MGEAEAQLAANGELKPLGFLLAADVSGSMPNSSLESMRRALEAWDRGEDFGPLAGGVGALCTLEYCPDGMGRPRFSPVRFERGGAVAAFDTLSGLGGGGTDFEKSLTWALDKLEREGVRPNALALFSDFYDPPADAKWLAGLTSRLALIEAYDSGAAGHWAGPGLKGLEILRESDMDAWVDALRDREAIYEASAEGKPRPSSGI